MGQTFSMALADLVNISGLVIALFSLWGLIWQILRTEGMEVEEGIYSDMISDIYHLLNVIIFSIL